MPVITSGIYDIQGRKYMSVDNLEIKVPWRYNRILGVQVTGLKTIYELRPGDIVKNVQFVTKKWNGETFYVLKSIDTS